jgi:hypothetical protein
MADAPERPMNWHRVFGLLLTDFFTGTPFVVELEKDLSIQKAATRRRHCPQGEGDVT